ncbi:GNAT family N-acetyltransferase [Luteimicrobium sp. NPDC057192]|uniref:GNAT family N-acetyltransferase n=1 Tax=Luteimicrobium sp. NPDC057192 TaxID=3346042 RepID=UPI00363BAF0D
MSRLRTAVADRLRKRLLPPEERVVPPFPAGGLAGRGVVVRSYRAETDAAPRLVLEQSAGMNLWRTAYASPMRDEAAARSWCESQRESLAAGTLPVALAIVDGDDRYLGDIEMLPVRDQRGAVEFALGMMPEARGRSYGIEASTVLLEWLAANARFQRFEVTHVRENRAACLVTGKVGLPKEGVKRGAFPVRRETGETVWHDMCLHGVPVAEFPTL